MATEEELRRARGAVERAVGRDAQPKESCCMATSRWDSQATPPWGSPVNAMARRDGSVHGVGRERRGRDAQRICDLQGASVQ
jgi:hypothetical protein